MKKIFLLFSLAFFFVTAQENNLNNNLKKNEVVDIGEIDFFTERKTHFLKKIKQELKKQRKIPFDLNLNYQGLAFASGQKKQEFIDNEFSFLMSYPYYYQIFFNVDRLIKENYYSFFVKAKNLEKTESNEKQKDFIVNSGYNSFHMGASLEFNFSKTKIDFLFSSTEEGSQKEQPNFNKIFSKKLQGSFYHQGLFIQDLDLSFLFHYGNFYAEPSYSFLKIQKSYNSGELNLVFNQKKSAYEGWSLFFNSQYNYWVKRQDFNLVNDLKVNYFFSVSDFNFLVSGGLVIAFNPDDSDSMQFLPTLHLSSQYTPFRNLKMLLSFQLKNGEQKLQQYFQEGKYIKIFNYHSLDYFFKSGFKVYYQIKDILTVSAIPYSTFYFAKNIEIFDEENPLFFHNEFGNFSFFEFGSQFAFNLRLGKFFNFNSQINVRKIDGVNVKVEDASPNFDKNLNLPLLLSSSGIEINLTPIASKINFNFYTTFDHWLMYRYKDFSKEENSSSKKGSNYQKVDSFDSSISYFFQYNINLSFYIHLNNLFNNTIYQINSLKLQRGRNMEFGLEYKF